MTVRLCGNLASQLEVLTEPSFFRSSHCDACSKAQILGVGRSSLDRRIRSKETLLYISFAVRVANFIPTVRV